MSAGVDLYSLSIFSIIDSICSCSVNSTLVTWSILVRFLSSNLFIICIIDPRLSHP